MFWLFRFVTGRGRILGVGVGSRMISRERMSVSVTRLFTPLFFVPWNLCCSIIGISITID